MEVKNGQLDLVVLTAPGYLPDEGKQINALFDAGMQILHLRKPENDRAKFRMLLDEIDPAYYPQITIHQHHDLEEEYQLLRLHYTTEQRRRTDAAVLAGLSRRGFHLSTSVHQMEELKELEEFEYTFFGPVYHSISKAGYDRTAEKFRPTAQRSKVYALGGVCAQRLAEISALGFSGAGVLGALWNQQQQPLDCFKKLQYVLNQVNDGN